MDIHSYLFGDQDAWSKHFFSDINWYYKRFFEEYSPFVNYYWWKQILHQLICSLGLARHLQGFIHPWWCRISSINSSIIPKMLSLTTCDISLAYKTCPSYLHTKMSQGQRKQHISKNSTPWIPLKFLTCPSKKKHEKNGKIRWWTPLVFHHHRSPWSTRSTRRLRQVSASARDNLAPKVSEPQRSFWLEQLLGNYPSPTVVAPYDGKSPKKMKPYISWGIWKGNWGEINLIIIVFIG